MTAEPKFGEWRAIDTARKDGTYILLYDERTDSAVVAAWDTSETDYLEAPIFGWMTLDGPGYMTLTFTHWQPLPAPPKSEEANG